MDRRLSRWLQPIASLLFLIRTKLLNYGRRWMDLGKDLNLTVEVQIGQGVVSVPIFIVSIIWFLIGSPNTSLIYPKACYLCFQFRFTCDVDTDSTQTRLFWNHLDDFTLKTGIRFITPHQWEKNYEISLTQCTRGLWRGECSFLRRLIPRQSNWGQSLLAEPTNESKGL